MSVGTGGGESRHSAREVALQVLYAVDLGETGPRDAAASRAAREATGGESAEGVAASGPAVVPGPGAASGPAEVPRRRRVPGHAVVARRKDAPEPAEAPAETAEEARARAFDRVAEHFPVPRSAVAFARELVDGVVARSATLDERIGRHARNWRVERMAAVDRNVLRLGVYELLETPTPVAVVIDEAVGLARRFGSETSPAFVNGVLDAVAKEVRGG